jgi:hypothetical protein
MFLFVKTKYFRYSFLDLGIKIFLLCLNRLLIGHKKYLVPLTIITNLVLSGFRIRNSYVIAGLAIKVDRFLIIGI